MSRLLGLLLILWLNMLASLIVASPVIWLGVTPLSILLMGAITLPLAFAVWCGLGWCVRYLLS